MYLLQAALQAESSVTQGSAFTLAVFVVGGLAMCGALLYLVAKTRDD
jgi:hypothetical protein